MPTEIIISPPHYTQGNIECIDAIRAAMSAEEYKGFLRGNIIKYFWRINLKGEAIDNVSKAIYYSNKLLEVLTEERLYP